MKDGKTAHVPGSEEYHLKMPMLSKTVYRFSAVHFIHKSRKSNLKMYMETQKTQVAEIILSRKSTAGSITIPDCDYYRVVVTAWHGIRQAHRPVAQSRDLRINPHFYSQMVHDKDAKNIRLERGSQLNKCCWEDWTSTCRRFETWPLPLIPTEANSKGIKDLTLRLETETARRKKGKHFKILESAMIFWLDPKSIGNKIKNWPMGLHQSKKLLHSKGSIISTWWDNL